LRLSCLVLALTVGLWGLASAQERSDSSIQGSPVTPVRTGIVCMEEAAEWDLILGLPFKDEITRRAPRPPRWLPELPRPKGSQPPPSPELAPVGSAAFVSTLDGRVRAIRTDSGVALWTTPLREKVTAAPAGMFKPSGAYDYILVGTSSGHGTEIIGVTDTGTALQEKSWSPLPLDTPSTPLLEPGTTRPYVGVRSHSPDGASLLRIDTATGSVLGSVRLESSAQEIGPPALDVGLSPDPNMIYVGSASGVLYAVEATF
jgi:outer membrane protein assembly factor BamB